MAYLRATPGGKPRPDPGKLLLSLRADRLREFADIDREHHDKAVAAILAFGDAYQVSFKYDRATPGHVRLLFDHRERALREMRNVLLRLPNDTGLETRLRAYIDWVDLTSMSKIEDVKKRCGSAGTQPVPLGVYYHQKHNKGGSETPIFIGDRDGTRGR
jgi:hypothetical protein